MGFKNDSCSDQDTYETCINDISRKLLTGHASVLIGSGFSKNSMGKTPHLKSPTWNELGTILYKKLHNQEPDQNCRFMNIMKLAQEVEVVFGIAELNQILKQSIPNECIEPSEAHRKLLELPWRDVFTTNYDTLLERSTKDVLLPIYNIVTDQNQIIKSNSPRIIKLNGSFPDKTPFIITQEDFRCYPKNFALFTNTVQQSIVENTLCLIGFSGDDPNFLNWIGWLRDHLGGYSPTMYLISLSSLPFSEKELLEKGRNIRVLELNKMYARENDSQNSYLLSFFNNIKSNIDSISGLNWNPEITIFKININSSDSKDEKLQKIKQITNRWKSQRKLYPKWIIVPYERRGSLWLSAYGWNEYVNWNRMKEIKDSIDNIDLEFAYEFDWIKKKCLNPYTENKAIKYYKEILSHINPCDINDDHLEMYFSLKLSVLQYYRRNFLLSKWEEEYRTLDQQRRLLSDQTQSLFLHEEILYHLFTLEFSQAFDKLKNTSLKTFLPQWELKKYGLILELFGNDAYEVSSRQLKETIYKLKNLMNNNISINNFELESVLSYLLQQQNIWFDIYTISNENVLNEETETEMAIVYEEEYDKLKKIHKVREKMVLSASEVFNTDNIISNNEQEDIFSLIQGQSFEVFWKSDSPRLKSLKNKIIFNAKSNINTKKKSINKQFLMKLKNKKCDPVNEILSSIVFFDQDKYRAHGFSETYNFDLGSQNQLIHIESSSSPPLRSYSCLLLFEEIGLPLNYAEMSLSFYSDLSIHKTIDSIPAQIKEESLFWSLITIIRLNKPKLVSEVLTRKIINSLTNSEIDKYVDFFNMKLQKALQHYDVELHRPILQTVPEILSRFCFRCSYDRQKELFQTLKIMYDFPHKNLLNNNKTFMMRLLRSISDQNLLNLLPKLLEFPILQGLGFYEKYDFPNPWDFINLDREYVKISEKPSISKELTKYLEGAKSKNIEIKKWCITTLSHLAYLHLLNKDIEKEYIDIVWSSDNIASDSFPGNIPFYRYVIVKQHLPIPSHIDSQDLYGSFRKYILSKIDAIKSPDDYTDCIIVFYEITRSSDFIHWNKKEVEKIFQKIKGLWDRSKEQSRSDNFFPRNFDYNDFFRLIFTSLVFILVYNPSIEPTGDMIDFFKDIIQFNYTHYFLIIKAFFSYRTAPLNVLLFKNDIRSYLSSGDSKQVASVITLTNLVLEALNSKRNSVPFLDNNWLKQTLKLFVEFIYWGKEKGLVEILNFLSKSMKKNPSIFEQSDIGFLLMGLENLIGATDIEKSDIYDAEQALLIRQNAAYLSCCIYQSFYKNTQLIPSTLKKWQDICSNQDEFAEIRNVWHE